MNLPLNIDLVQVLLHMLNLVILAGGLTLILYRPLMSFLKKRQEEFEAREEKIRQGEQENEQLKAEYEKRLQDAETEITERRLATEQEIAKTAAGYLDDAKKKADDLLRTAEESAEQRKEHILESAQTEIQELVLSAAQKLLADTATPRLDEELYDRFLENAAVAKENRS